MGFRDKHPYAPHPTPLKLPHKLPSGVLTLLPRRLLLQPLQHGLYRILPPSKITLAILVKLLYNLFEPSKAKTSFLKVEAFKRRYYDGSDFWIKSRTFLNTSETGSRVISLYESLISWEALQALVFPP